MAPGIQMIELVVARYGENLNWLRKVPKAIRVTVYDKNPDAPHLGAFRLPNIGREAHTYLFHLIQRYDALAPVTVFCQGKPFDHAFDFHRTLREFPSIEGFRWFGHIVDTDTCDGALFRSWSKNEDGRGLDFPAFHRALLGDDGPQKYPFYLGAQFAVTRELVRQKPREWYEKALELSTNFPDAAHLFERTWDRVFGATGVDPEWLGGRKTVYLKPIRRLEN